MLENLLQKGKCRLGMHVGEWGYVATADCHQQRVCVHCEAVSEQVVHLWQEFEPDGAVACGFVRRCARCAEEESKVEHVWGPAVYAGDSSCAQVRVCVRCQAEETAGTAHIWDAWAYAEDDSCTQLLACSRCGLQSSESRFAHDWSDWQASEFYDGRVAVCRHCGEMALDLAGDAEHPDAVPSFQTTYRALWDVIASPDGETMRQRIRVHQDLLLQPVALRCADFSIDQILDDDESRSAMRTVQELLQRLRREGIDAVFGLEQAEASPTAIATMPTKPQSVAPAQGVPAVLCAHWRSTELAGSLSSDTHLVLATDGRFAWWSVSVQFGESEREYGTWRAADAVLSLAFDDGTQFAWPYETDGNALFIPSQGRYRLWERV